MSWFILSTIASGVLAGAMMPYQVDISKPGMSDFAMMSLH